MKCEICGKDILNNSQCINYKYYHNDCIENLQQENKQLKENYERIYNENCKLREEHNITDISLLDENQELKQKYLNAVADYETTMSELQELKKKLEEYKHKGLYNTCLPYTTGYNTAIKYKENQQKEFIDYLEDWRKAIKKQYKELNEPVKKSFLKVIIDTIEEILSKYKSIIGVSDDKTN